MKYTILLVSLFFWVESGYAFFASNKSKQGTMVMTVDWEGKVINDQNFQTFSNLKKIN